ncbi:MAG: hypothetical protein LBQ31_09295 [Bacteroidales bacterium]|jgi:hypothetical protein|nr:hypothetical protein [Bacteroidales bacterium]
MAGVKISELESAVNINTSDVFPIVSKGLTKKASISQVLSFIPLSAPQTSIEVSVKRDKIEFRIINCPADITNLAVMFRRMKRANGPQKLHRRHMTACMPGMSNSDMINSLLPVMVTGSDSNWHYFRMFSKNSYDKEFIVKAPSYTAGTNRFSNSWHKIRRYTNNNDTDKISGWPTVRCELVLAYLDGLANYKVVAKSIPFRLTRLGFDNN